MKILIITPRIPYPPYRGDKLKIFNICKILLKRNEVKVLTFNSKSSEIHDLYELKKGGIDTDAVELSRFRSFLNLIRSFYTSDPMQVSYYRSKQMRDKIHELTSKDKYDVIYFHLINSAQYINSVANSNSLKVIDFTDASSLYLKRYLDFLKNPFRKLIFKWELKRTIKYEKSMQAFDTLFVCSSVDKDYLIQRNVHPNIQLLLNGIDLDSFKYEKTHPEKGRIIFAGNMSYFPNIDAVIYFTKKIFPKILTKIPYAKFCIVGQQPPKEVLALRSKNIVVTGFVSDIKKEYSLSEVNVAPIRFGSGTLNKIIESLALGIPTVATGLSIAGSPNELKKFILTADTPESFAEKVVSVLNNKSIIDDQMKEAIEVTGELLGWEKVVNNFEDYLRMRVEKRKNLNN